MAHAVNRSADAERFSFSSLARHWSGRAAVARIKRRRVLLAGWLRSPGCSAGVVFFPVVAVALAGCGGSQPLDGPAEPRSVTVFAATSLTDAFIELAAAYEVEHPGVRVVFNFAGSSFLSAQLREGVAADVFASANPAQMQALIEAGRIARGTETAFASNRLTIVVPHGNPASITMLGDLARPGVQLILAAEGVPVREYTDEIVAAMPFDFQQGFYANVVSGELNVRQVSAKIALGEADAGIVYQSDVTPDIADQIQQIAIPEAQNVTASYPIAPVVDAPQPELARSFIAFVLGAEGQRILAGWGFGPLPEQ